MPTAATRRRTQPERREEAETRLIKAAIGLLAQRGYDGFTLAEVGEAAGYSRGLPSHYFPRKDDLLAAAAQYAVDAYAASGDTFLVGCAGIERIASAIRHHASTAPNDSSRALGLLIAEAAIRPQLRTTIASLNQRGIARLQDELVAGIAAGTIRAGIDTGVQARMIFAFLRGQMSFAALDGEFHARAVSEAFIATLEQSLVPTAPTPA